MPKSERNLNPETRTRSADFQVCCIAGFQTCAASGLLGTTPTWKSATQQVWKPAAPLQPLLNSALRFRLSEKHGGFSLANAPTGRNVNSSGWNPETTAPIAIRPWKGRTALHRPGNAPSGRDILVTSVTAACTHGYSRSIPPGFPRPRLARNSAFGFRASFGLRTSNFGLCGGNA